jgi:G6PDH family F420-dependent oxidoreductase
VPVPIPVGLNPTSIGVTSRWWLEAARSAEQAGFSAVWSWDHFISRGDPRDQVLECWTTLAGVAAHTERMRVGSWVTAVMNRHPSVLARTAATLHEASGGRLSIGIGVGGEGMEQERLGIDFPPIRERAERLEEAVTILRHLFAGGPASFEGRYYRLRDAIVHPVSGPPPLIVVAGQSPAGARLAARIGDAWTTDEPFLTQLLPVFEESLAAAGRSRADVPILVGVPVQDQGRRAGDVPVVADLAGEAARLNELGANELVLGWVRPEGLGDILRAAERAGLGDRQGVPTAPSERTR